MGQSPWAGRPRASLSTSKPVTAKAAKLLLSGGAHGVSPQKGAAETTGSTAGEGFPQSDSQAAINEMPISGTLTPNQPKRCIRSADRPTRRAAAFLLATWAKGRWFTGRLP